MLEMSVF